MQFFQKKTEQPQSWSVAWLDVATGQTGYGIPIYSRTAAERFAERFNEEHLSKIYTVEPCTSEMLLRARIAGFQRRCESLEFALFDERVPTKIVGRLRTEGLVLLICSISQSGTRGALIYALKAFAASFWFDLKVWWYEVTHRRQIQEDIEAADFNDLLGEVIDEQVRG